MPTTPDCPEFANWQALLADPLPANEQERFERHLASCPVCQERIDRGEEGEDELRELARQVGDPTVAPADPTLSHVLERLHESKAPERTAPAEPADLYFLHPSDELGVLGTLGNYEVYEVIGQGGMGVVLKALEPALHRLVAIKVMAAAVAGSATARRRFTREAQAAAAVCHDHVVTVHGVHEEDGLPYLVMQYVPGESLQGRLDRTGALEVLEIVRIGLQTAQGLAAAHAQGLIHRDIKPANLLLENGLARVKITDFGLARMTDDVGLTQNGVVAGTPEYMAPEQARGETVDHRADLFSLGSVLYAMCTGVPPFRASTTVAVIRQVSDQEPVPIRVLNADIPAWLEALVRRLQAKDPADRFQSAAEVAELLEGYLAHLRQPATVSAPDLPPFPAGQPVDAVELAPVPGRGRRRFRAAVLFLTALGLISWLLAQVLPPEGKLHEVLVHDFRGRELPPGMVAFGPVLTGFPRVEPEGVRLTLARDRNSPEPVGLCLPLTLAGDFDVVLAFAILQAEEPAPGTRSYGVGVLMSVNESARIGRLVREKENQVVTWDHWATVDGNRKFLSGAVSAGGKVGRLRLKRTRSTLHFLWGPELTGDSFAEIHKYEFGDQDVNRLRLELNADVGGRQGLLDVRLLELKIDSATPSLELVPSEEERKTRSKGWLVAAGILGTVLLLGLVVCLIVRRRVRARTLADLSAHAGVPDPDGKARCEGHAASLAVRCSACGKTLRVRAELAGKKVKCPQCLRALVVPAIKAAESRRTSS